MAAIYIFTMDSIIARKLLELRDEAQSLQLQRFFKTAPGQYGEGDRFLGVRVPQTRSIVKHTLASAAPSLKDTESLLFSQWHEIRLAGFLVLVELYSKAHRAKDHAEKRLIVEFYLDNIHRGNNWDLVDLVAPKILGQWLVEHPEERTILYRLAACDDKLWHQRVAIVSTLALIKNKEFGDTIRIAELYLSHPHDLIHKASGWMLREVGKAGGMQDLCAFLDRNAAIMPRTMLRYAIERFEPELRKAYMKR